MRPIRILLADDHIIVRQGLSALINNEKDMQVIGEVSDGLQLLEQAERLHPDVALVDLKMPHLNGIDSAEQIRRKVPACSTVILSMYADRSYVERALQAGVCGYVLKEEEFSEIAAAIRQAAQKRRFLSRAVLERLPELAGGFSPAFRPVLKLTLREREILQMVAEGRTSQETANLLGISARTVEGHRANIRSKYHLKSSLEFVRFAIQHTLPEDTGEGLPEN